jgi:hypothetical protein
VELVEISVISSLHLTETEMNPIPPNASALSECPRCEDGGDRCMRGYQDALLSSIGSGDQFSDHGSCSMSI